MTPQSIPDSDATEAGDSDLLDDLGPLRAVGGAGRASGDDDDAGLLGGERVEVGEHLVAVHPRTPEGPRSRRGWGVAAAGQRARLARKDSVADQGVSSMPKMLRSPGPWRWTRRPER